ncbi:ATP-binding protein [Streptomyces sp. NPDC055109]
MPVKVLLERDAERAELRVGVEDLRRGESEFIAVIGPAGVGKTRLLDEVREDAASGGAQVLAARGGQSWRVSSPTERSDSYLSCRWRKRVCRSGRSCSRGRLGL